MENILIKPEIVDLKEEILDRSENNEDEAKSFLDHSEVEERQFQSTESPHNMVLRQEDRLKLKNTHAERKFVNAKEIEEVKRKLKEHIYILTPKEGARSEVWKKFHIIIDAVTDEKTAYVQCIFCKFIRKYSGTTEGTSQLLRHYCEKKESPYVNMTKQCLTTMLKSCVEFCAIDMQSLEILEGPGFKKLAQCLIDLGAETGRLRIGDIMPVHTTLTKQVLQEVLTTRQELFKTIYPYIERGESAISLNNWTDERTAISYTNVTCNYIDENWTFNSCLMFTFDTPEIKNTNDIILKKILRRITSLGYSKDLINSITFVSDQFNKGICNLKNYDHIPCAQISFNRVIEKVLCSQFTERETPKIHHTLSGLNSFVKFLNQSGLSSRLSQPIPLRKEETWKEKLQSITLIVQQSAEIYDLVKKTEGSDWFENFNVVVAQELIEFLKLFEEAIEDLTVEQKPSLHLVFLWHKKMLNYCAEVKDNSVDIKKLKERAVTALNSLFPIDYRHKIATFLWPPVRKMKMLSDTERSQFMRGIQLQLSAMNSEEPDVDDPLTDDEPPEKVRKTHFDHWMEAPSEVELMNDEIYKYLMSMPNNNESKLLIWWKQNEMKLPRLARLVKKYLCIPATKKHSEKLFEPARILLQGRPTEMDPSMVVGLNILHEIYNST